MVYYRESSIHNWDILAKPWRDDFEGSKWYYPAWSLHRLIEMMPNVIDTQGWLSIGHQGLHYSRGYGVADDGLYESIVRMYEWLIKEGHFNKEYLV